MPWRITQIEISALASESESENISEAPSVHIWHGFTYSSVCSKANGQLNPRSFKSKESFGTMSQMQPGISGRHHLFARSFFPGERSN